MLLIFFGAAQVLLNRFLHHGFQRHVVLEIFIAENGPNRDANVLAIAAPVGVTSSA